MGFFDSFSDLIAAASPWTTVEAEAVAGGSSTETTPAQKDDGGEGEAKDPSGPTPDKRMAADSKDPDDDNDARVDEDKEEGSTDADDADSASDEEQEEDDDDDEDIVDPKEKFEEECKESKGCSGPKHHYDECVERVTHAHKESDKKHPGEDCVEEFFHLAHCASACAAPKLWKALK